MVAKPLEASKKKTDSPAAHECEAERAEIRERRLSAAAPIRETG
jgi:hypothetical protein